MEDEKHKLFSERDLFDSGSHDALEQLADGLVNLLVNNIMDLPLITKWNLRNR